MVKIPRFLASPDVPFAQVGGQVDPGTFGALQRTGLEGVGLQELGGEIVQFSAEQEAKDKQRVETSYLTSNLTDFQVESIEEFENRQTVSGENVQGFTDSFREWFGKRRQQILSQAPTEDSQIRMEAKLGQLEARYVSQGISHERRTMKATRLAAVDRVSNRLINRIRLNPAEAEVVGEQVNNLFDPLANEGVSAGTLAKLKDNVQMKIKVAQLEGVALKDPNQALEMLTMEEFQDIPPQTFERILVGTSKQVLGQLQEDNLKNLYFSKLPLDPNNKEHRAAADAAFNDFVKNQINPDNGKVEVSNKEFVANTLAFLEDGSAIMPPKLKTLLEANIINGNPENQVLYSKLVQQIDANPRLRPLLDTLNGKTVSEATMITRLVESGTAPEQAVEIARQQIREPRSDLVAANRLAIKREELLTEDSVIEALEDEFGDVNNLGIAFDAYKNLFYDNFEQVGDADLSQDQAFRQLNRTFGVSKINGEKELMRLPPEKLYPNQMNDFREKVGQFLNDVSGKSVNPVDIGLGENVLEFFTGQDSLKVNINGEDQVVRLQSDVLTGKGKGYALTHITELPDGTLANIPILDQTTGLPARFVYEPGDITTTFPNDEIKLDKFKKNREDLNARQKRINQQLKDIMGSSVEFDKNRVMDMFRSFDLRELE